MFSNAWLPQLFKAQGADVLNGLQIVPDPEFCRALDPDGEYEEVWNRYAFMVLEEAKPGSKPEFRTLNPSAYVLKIAPENPILRARGARFAVFPRPPQGVEVARMIQLAAFPAQKIWIYRLP
ncbi:MAG: hypothetical protein M3Y80_01095 [Verrucomicrobiota bacterium]|nr:hypothetical protein [Verrucomicrobiota bacterium]